MRHRRRMALGLGFVGLVDACLPGCRNKDSEKSSPMGNVLRKKLSSSELVLLSDFEVRRKRFGEKQLNITNCLFDDDVRMESFTWENTEFVDCDFIGSTMLKGTLKNVRFKNCMFDSSTLKDGSWDNVVFSGCAARGKFNLGTAYGGDLLVDDCEFIGATKEEIGYGGRSEQYGSIGGAGVNVVYQNCQFTRTYINGGKTLTIKNSTLSDVVIDAHDQSSLVLEGVKAQNVIDFGAGQGDYADVKIRKSTFENSLVFANAKIGTALFEDVQANINLNTVKAKEITLRRFTFLSPKTAKPHFRYGLAAESAKIAGLTIEDSSFAAGVAAIDLAGVEDSATDIQKKVPGYKNLDQTVIERLTIRNTPIKRGTFEYMTVDTLVLENLSIADANFSNSRIRRFVARDVIMAGKVEFANTRIREKVYERVANSSTGTPPTVMK